MDALATLAPYAETGRGWTKCCSCQSGSDRRARGRAGDTTLEAGRARQSATCRRRQASFRIGNALTEAHILLAIERARGGARGPADIAVSLGIRGVAVER